MHAAYKEVDVLRLDRLFFEWHVQYQQICAYCRAVVADDHKSHHNPTWSLWRTRESGTNHFVTSYCSIIALCV